MSGAIYDDTPAYPVARRITRGPNPDEERALRDLVKAVRRAAAQVIAEQERDEQHERRVERVR